MAEGTITVKTADEKIIEVDLAIAKEWQPVKNIFQSKSIN